MKEEFDKLIYDFLSEVSPKGLHKLNEWIYSDPRIRNILNSRNELASVCQYENVSVHEERAYSRFAETNP